MMALRLWLLAILFNTALAGRADQGAWPLTNFRSLVAFGDSYTDESRIGYFISHKGTAPPAGWKNPVSSTSSTGGFVWARYVSWYTGSNLYNYAVGGAVCSNRLTPRIFDAIKAPFPAVIDYEVPAFIADKAYVYPENGTSFLDVPSSQTVYSMWIGTNDVGSDAFLSDSQVLGKTLVDYLDCVYQSLDKLYAAGARYFVLMNLIPLNLTPQYALPQGEDFEDDSVNRTEVSFRMMEQVVLVNANFKTRIPYEVKVARRYPEAHFALFDVWSLFDDIFHSPTEYLNGTATPNVTTWINQCDENGEDCARKTSPDSYLWYDRLHPSEQADRIVAQEFVKVAKGGSKYASYWAAQ